MEATTVESAFMSRRETSEFVGVPTRTLRDWETEGVFPQRRKLGPRRVGWLRTEVVAWVKNRPPVEPPERDVTEPAL